MWRMWCRGLWRGLLLIVGRLRPLLEHVPKKPASGFGKRPKPGIGKKGKDGERPKHASSTNNAHAVALPDWLAAT
jgi:hypothetical protein